MGIFSDIAPLYIESDLIVVPCAGKIPVQKNWPNSSLEMMADYADILSDKKYNVGLICGAANNVIAVDLDSFKEYHDKLLDLFPPSPVRKVGKKGITCFYRFNGEASKKFYVNKQTFCEILSTGNQTILPPSIHPETGTPYTWKTTESLLDIPPAELPTLPDNYIELIESVVREIESGETQTTPTESGRHNVLFSQIRAAIDKNKAPQEIAYEIYNFDKSQHATPWLSDTSEKPFHGVPRTQPQRLALTWVLYEYSKVLEKDKAEIELAPPIEMTVNFASKEDLAKLIIDAGHETPRQQIATRLETLAMEAPGVCGDIVRWIVESAKVPQPAIALGAALTVLGTLKAHKVCTDEDARTNHFITTLAESGSGKDHPLKCANLILEQLGMTRHIGGDPASDAALIRVVADAKGIAFIALDEIGLKMKSLSHAGASSQEMGIVRQLTQLWSSANGIYRGKEYANHDKKMNRKEINQPCVNVYGTTEPVSFYKALKTAEMQGGFLPRWLLFQISNPDVSPCRTRKRKMPIQLLERLREIAETEIEYDKALNVNIGVDCDALTPIPRVVEFTPKAVDLLDCLQDIFAAKKKEARKLEKGIDSLWARGTEHTSKVALTVASAVIAEKDIKWAGDVVTCSLSLASQLFLEHASESAHEERSNKILSIISKNQGITKRELIRKTQSISVRERDETIASLEASEVIKSVVSAAEGTSKKVTSYFLVEA